MSKIKQLLIIISISVVLAWLVVLLYLLDPAFVPDTYRVTSMVIVTCWAFFITPSMLFVVQLAKNYFEGKSPERAFKDGARIGVIMGFGGMLVGGLLVCPITGILWYIHTIKLIVSKKNNNTLNNQNETFGA